MPGLNFPCAHRARCGLLGMGETTMKLGVVPDPEVELVAYQTTNQITNTGKNGWQKESGLLSILIQGMYNPGPQTTILIPFATGSDEVLGPILNNGDGEKIPQDRLRFGDGILFLKGDGLLQSRIGISARRAKPMLGVYDGQLQLLTLIQFTQQPEATEYASTEWRSLENPYDGDVIAAENNHAPAPGEKNRILLPDHYLIARRAIAAGRNSDACPAHDSLSGAGRAA